jgi:uncharacterized protein YcsI (UPF0317 family)
MQPMKSQHKFGSASDMAGMAADLPSNKHYRMTEATDSLSTIVLAWNNSVPI